MGAVSEITLLSPYLVHPHVCKVYLSNISWFCPPSLLLLPCSEPLAFPTLSPAWRVPWHHSSGLPSHPVPILNWIIKMDTCHCPAETLSMAFHSDYDEVRWFLTSIGPMCLGLSCLRTLLSAVLRTLMNVLFLRSSCQSCHACFSICLTGSLLLRLLRDLSGAVSPYCHYGQPTSEPQSTSMYCAHLFQTGSSS